MDLSLQTELKRLCMELFQVINSHALEHLVITIMLLTQRGVQWRKHLVFGRFPRQGILLYLNLNLPNPIWLCSAIYTLPLRSILNLQEEDLLVFALYFVTFRKCCTKLHLFIILCLFTTCSLNSCGSSKILRHSKYSYTKS